MIKLSDGELLDLLPAQLKYDTDMICLSYALKCGIEKLLEYEKGTMTANFIDSLPEKILDVLAVELRSLYYSDDMDIETKRQIIKNTFIWHFKAGTASATSEMIAAVFGEGSLVEWFNFEDGEGDPYTFDIETNARLTEDIYNQLLSIIDRVKNMRSHLRWIKIDRDIDQTEHVAVGVTGSPRVSVTNTRAARERDASLSGIIATGVVSAPKITIGNTMEAAESLEKTARYAAAAMSHPKITIK
ncbi:MAG: phage tail protein [Clostridiales bacterium]|nr:phage tail protein [Clostridiales bacterium]